MSPRCLYLTFGPVQEYLTQARRTRDLWAGSYLLSFLAAHALHKADSKVLLPVLDKNALFKAVASGGKAQPDYPGDRVGSVPHFSEIEVSKGKQPRDIADQAIAAQHAAWKQVADAVRRYAENKFPGWAKATSSLWDQQVNPAELWTAIWVTDAASTGQRKTLRSFTLSEVRGEKCTVCGIRQALHSGDDSLRGTRAFWEGIANNLGAIEIRPGGRERLCAPCTVKRLYPLVSGEALGWAVPTGYPSTATMATIPWRARVLERGQTNQALRKAVADYVAQLKRASVPRPLDHGRFPGLRALGERWGAERNTALEFLCYDGDWFSADGIRSAEDVDETQRTSLLAEIARLQHIAGQAGIPEPGTSYALLAMDGDHMGDLLKAVANSPENKRKVSEVLGNFSQQDVVSLVAQANGVLIYAGGDDLMALLPSTTALDTARDLRVAFVKTFQNELPPGTPKPTISAGLVFAHMHAPLQQVVKAARNMLEEEAKRKAKRNAIGIRVWKRAGVALTFASKWDSWDGGVLEDVEKVKDGIKATPPTYSRSFLHRLCDLMAVTSALTADEEKAVLVAEYLKSRRWEKTRAEAESAVAPVQRLVRQRPKPEDVSPIMLPIFLAEQE